MTGLLEEAPRRVESLSREEQDAIASQIMETLDDEEAWARSFREKPAALQSMAREALEEHRRGETRPLDELKDEVVHLAAVSRNVRQSSGAGSNAIPRA
jgi:hypothetical protein